MALLLDRDKRSGSPITVDGDEVSCSPITKDGDEVSESPIGRKKKKEALLLEGNRVSGFPIGCR